MKKPTCLIVSTLFVWLGSSIARSEMTQVGDLRIDPDAYSGAVSRFDPGFSMITREVEGSQIQIGSSLTGVSQQATPIFPGDAATDFGIRTSGEVTTLKNVNRYGQTAESIPGKVGAFQFEIDLAPLEGYLSDSGETLSELSLQLTSLLGSNAQDKPYDIYLSYTEESEGITETSISLDDSNANFTELWLPSQGGAVGDVIDGSHKIVSLAGEGDLNLFEDLTSIYQSGVRKLNLMIVVPSFFSGRTFTIEAGSGIYFETEEGGFDQVADLRIKANLYPSFYHADQIGPLETQSVPNALFDLPVVFRATSQNQGANPEPTLSPPTAIHSLDGVAGGSTSFGGKAATVNGFGMDGIGVGESDGFEYVAWMHEGDLSVDVELTSLTSLESGARAGLMIRGTSDADSAHVFIGLQSSGEPVVVARGAKGATATETVGSFLSVPQRLRIVRTGDLFEFFISADGLVYEPAPLASASVVFAEPVMVGLVAASGSDLNDSVAEFAELSVNLPTSETDIGLNSDPNTGSTVITTLNRYFNEFSGGDAGALQWSIDLSPLDGYLGANSLALDAIDLRFLATPSDAGKPFDVYLSYSDPSVPIELSSISSDNGSVNKERFFDPAVDASVGDVITGSHRVLWASTEGDIDLSEDLLELYQRGVRELNLIVMTNQYYKNRNLSVLEGSGIFIETSGGIAGPISITAVSRASNTMSITVDGLVSGATYHLGGSPDLASFPPLPGTDLVATGSSDIFTVDSENGTFFVRVLEGSGP